MFFTLFGDWWGGGGGSPNGVQFFTLYSSKIKVFETYFFDIVTTHNDHPSYVQHVLGSSYVFFTLFGDSVWRGGQLMEWYTTCSCRFSPWTAQKSKFSTLFFLIP